MSKSRRKPQGFKEFDSLARKLVQVPKAEVEKEIKKAAKKAKRKK